MGTPSPGPTALVEHLAGLVLSVEPDPAGLDTLTSALAELQQQLPDGAPRLTVTQALASAQELRGIAPREALRAISDAVTTLQQGEAAPKRLDRDDETLELVRDFLQESGDGLTVADELLLRIESSDATADQVNALFRVFHSIKGVAGFLELREVVALAHSTESLMNEVRDGRCPLAGEALELVFKATARLRAVLEALRSACEAGVALAPQPEATALVGRLEAFLAALPATAESTPLPSLPQGYEPLFTPLPSSPSGARLRETVKVDLERVDGMVEMIGELIIVESMLKHAREPGGPAMRQTLNQLGKISRDLQNAAMRMRTVPLHQVFQKMARLTREVGRRAGKDVVLVIQGEGTEMDRAMVERLEDPLVHMVRNAVDHGIESPAERVAAGKPPGGVLTLTARHQGDGLVIELSDDGRGLDRERIAQKAVERGLVQHPAALSEQETFQLIFAPGFSTAPRVTEVSGRGVGMDVVKRNVEAMRGRVFLESTKGQGTTFRLALPLTLAIIDGMLITVGAERYLVPSLSIVEALQPTRAMLSSMAERHELLSVRGQVLPLLRLAVLLGVEGARDEPTSALVVVVESLGTRVALLVDQVVAQQQVVIKPLGQGVGRAELYSGAAILSDGNVGLILNVDKLCSLISYQPRADARGAPLEAHP